VAAHHPPVPSASAVVLEEVALQALAQLAIAQAVVAVPSPLVAIAREEVALQALAQLVIAQVVVAVPSPLVVIAPEEVALQALAQVVVAVPSPLVAIVPAVVAQLVQEAVLATMEVGVRTPEVHVGLSPTLAAITMVVVVYVAETTRVQVEDPVILVALAHGVAMGLHPKAGTSHGMVDLVHGTVQDLLLQVGMMFGIGAQIGITDSGVMDMPDPIMGWTDSSSTPLLFRSRRSDGLHHPVSSRTDLNVTSTNPSSARPACAAQASTATTSACPTRM